MRIILPLLFTLACATYWQNMRSDIADACPFMAGGPSRRIGSAHAYADRSGVHHIYLWGGRATFDDQEGGCVVFFSNDLWSYDPLLNTWDFLEGDFLGIEVHGDEPWFDSLPSRRDYASLLYSPRSDVLTILFGRFQEEFQVGEEVVYNGLLVRAGDSFWRSLAYSADGPYSYTLGVPRPPPHFRSSAIMYDDSLAYLDVVYTFGGLVQCNGEKPDILRPKMEVWKFDIYENSMWENLHVRPGRRCDQIGESIDTDADAELRCAGNEWTKGHFCLQASPLGRFGHAVWVDATLPFPLFFIYGGESQVLGNPVFLNDVWMFDANLQQWAWVSGSGVGQGPSVNTLTGVYGHANLPGARRDMGVSRWEDPNSVVIVGGFGYEELNAGLDPGLLNSVWMWSNEWKMWAFLDGEPGIDFDGSPDQISSREGLVALRNEYSLSSWKGSVVAFRAFDGLVYNGGGTKLALTDVWSWGRRGMGLHCGGVGSYQPFAYACAFCEPGYTGTQCEEYFCGAYRAWDPLVCSGHGVCESPGICNCEVPYGGPICDRGFQCNFVDSSDPGVCLGHGDCVAPDLCECDPYYFGPDCEEHVYNTVMIYPAESAMFIPWVFPKPTDMTPEDRDIFHPSNLIEGVCEFRLDPGDPTMTFHLVVNYTTLTLGAFLGVYPRLRPDLTVYLDYVQVISGCECNGVDVNDPDVCSSHGSCDCLLCTCYASSIPGGSYFGPDCEFWRCYGIESTSGDVCSGHGICAEDTTCNCSVSYSGDECDEFLCFGLSKDDPNVCFGHGNCTSPDHCECAPSFDGLNCELAWCGDYRSDMPEVCSGHGVCFPSLGGCKCYPGYEGDECGIFECFGYGNTNPLSCNNGKCVAVDTCECGDFCDDDDHVVSREQSPGCYTGRACTEKVFPKVLLRKSLTLSLVHELEGFGSIIDVDPAFLRTEMLSVGWNAYFNCSVLFRNSAVLFGSFNSSTACVFHADGTFTEGLTITLGEDHLLRPKTELEFRYLSQIDWFGDVKYHRLQIKVQGLTELEIVSIAVSAVFFVVFLLAVVLVIFLVVCVRSRFRKSRVKSRALRDVDRELDALEGAADDDETARATLHMNKDLFKIELDDIELLKKIGESNATVWLGRWAGNLVAVKLFTTRDLFGSSQALLTDFERECELLSSINYPSCLKFYGPVLGATRVGLVIEYLPGGNLRELILESAVDRHIDLTFDRKVLILTRVAEAMRYLHGRNVIHRDLKLSNIMFDKHDAPRIIDYGLSRIIDTAVAESGLTRRVGSSYYMAPECCTEDSYGPPVDAFSFGIILFEVLTEKVPAFDDIGPAMELRIANDPTFRPQIDEAEYEFVMWYVILMQKCWQANPDDRPDFDMIVRCLTDRSFGSQKRAPAPPAPSLPRNAPPPVPSAKPHALLRTLNRGPGSPPPLPPPFRAAPRSLTAVSRPMSEFRPTKNWDEGRRPSKVWDEPEAPRKKWD